MKCRHNWKLKQVAPKARWHQCKKCATVRTTTDNGSYVSYYYLYPNKDGIPHHRLVKRLKNETM